MAKKEQPGHWTPGGGAKHGTAKLILRGPDEVALAFAEEGSLGVVLGLDTDDAGKGASWVPGFGAGHALTFGATRAGKGVSTIIPALLTYKGSMVVIDPKGENAWVTAERRRQLGQRVVILDPWGEVNRRYAGGKPVEEVTRFNPLALLDPAGPEFADDVALLTEALITSAAGDPHWTDSAKELLGGLIAAYVQARPGRATLSDIREALLTSQEDFGKTVEFFQQGQPDSLGARKLAGFKVGSREIDSIRSTAKTQTAFLDSTRLRENLAGEEGQPFDLGELASGQVTLYLVLPVDRLQSHGRWLRLILTLALRVIGRQPGRPELPVLFMLDEMGTVGRLSMVEQAFGLMAGLGVRLWGFLQDLNQVKRDYPDSWETFIANSDVIQILNARDNTTSEYFSQYFGKSTIVDVSTYTKSIRTGTSLFHKKDPNMVTGYDKLEGRPVLFPDEIRRISNSNCFVIYTQGDPIILTKLSYYKDQRLMPMARPLPQHLIAANPTEGAGVQWEFVPKKPPKSGRWQRDRA